MDEPLQSTCSQANFIAWVTASSSLLGSFGRGACYAETGGHGLEEGRQFLNAERASGTGEGPAPIQVRAQLLRENAAGTRPGSTGGFVLPDPVSACAESLDERSDWRPSDIKRAIAAAREAGLEDYRIEIGTDGTIAIVVGRT